MSAFKSNICTCLLWSVCQTRTGKTSVLHLDTRIPIQMDIFREMLTISSSHLKGSKRNGPAGGGARVLLGAFHPDPKKAPSCWGSRAFWEPCRLATPASKSRSHTSVPSLQQARMQRSDVQGKDEYPLSSSAGRKHQAGTFPVPLQLLTTSVGSPQANVFPASASSPRIIS